MRRRFPLDLARKYGGSYAGMTAALMQRVTGLALLGYLFVHVRTIRELRAGPDAFDAAVAVFRSPLFKLGEIALLGAVILHALNGVRITLLDLGIGHARQQVFWYLALGLGGLIFLAGALPMFLFSVLRL